MPSPSKSAIRVGALVAAGSADGAGPAGCADAAGAGDVQTLANTIAERKIPAIFVESSIPRATIEAVQEAPRSRGWDVKIGGSLYSDAMGEGGTPDGTYIGMVRHNVSTIVESLAVGT